MMTLDWSLTFLYKSQLWTGSQVSATGPLVLWFYYPIQNVLKFFSVALQICRISSIKIENMIGTIQKKKLDSLTNEPLHDKINKLVCVPSEDTDQPGRPPTLIKVFAVHMKKLWGLSYPLSAQRRLFRLDGCPGWLEFLLGQQVIMLILSWGGSFNISVTKFSWLISVYRYMVYAETFALNVNWAGAQQNLQNHIYNRAQQWLRSARLSAQYDQSLCYVWLGFHRVLREDFDQTVQLCELIQSSIGAHVFCWFCCAVAEV